ncbi:DNA/RNA non-specific endonuclease [uncultured Alistipes sp.]|uniref:DNA/RNA non-specific endonuclease n=1 Tax=uncultured Alistipes sp. TaxID=538949 RepID=UPI0025982AB9|nr:DNA/RNA non-specific endonuclease [uncultured Alistipes sp.]
MALCALSCGDDAEDGEEPFAQIVTASFVFDETDPAANTVQVVSNTAWQVTYTPSDVFVKAEPLAGSGVGSFRIVQMPQGISIQVNVRPVAGGTAGGPITVTRAAGENPDPDPDPTPVPAYRFPELPSNWVAPTGSTAALKDDRAFFTHWSKSVKSKKTVRNYSYCYDTRRHNPVWVAYPLHPVYREGGTGRTDPDPWAPDPALDERYQSKIYKHDGEGDGIYDGYQFWGNTLLKSLGKGGYWSKGHLCMSSERGGKDAELNIQTFHPTNIAPQSSAAASDFATVWSYVETLFSGTNDYKNTDFTADDGSQNINIVADTLFLVAGCYYEHDDWADYDASNYNETPPTSGLSKKCIMPTHQFKIALRTKKGNTGKRIADCTADELQAIGFWIEAFPTVSGTSATAELNRRVVPVSFIEEKMGIEFFPDVPASVKASYNSADWGF